VWTRGPGEPKSASGNRSVTPNISGIAFSASGTLISASVNSANRSHPLALIKVLAVKITCLKWPESSNDFLEGHLSTDGMRSV
jgi:hypothetical protein